MKRSSLITYKRAGFSLPEILVSLFLLSFVIAALGGLMREAVRFYTDQSVTLEVQKNCVLALQKLRLELREASIKSFDTSTPNQVTLGSPRSLEGSVIYGDGRLMWHKFVRFSVQEVNGSSVLVREDDLLDRPTTMPPPAEFADFSEPDAQSVQARNINALKVTLNETNAEVEIKARYGDIFEMTLETEVKLQN